jgi:hypothetical protein
VLYAWGSLSNLAEKKCGKYSAPDGSGGGLLAAKLFDPSRFTFAVAEVEELGTANPATADHFDPLDAVGIEGEDPLDADVVGTHFADGECLTGSLAAERDTDTFKVLDPLFVTLFDTYRDTDGVTGTEIGNVLACDLSLFEALDIFVFHALAFARRYRSGRKYFVLDKAIRFLMAVILL